MDRTALLGSVSVFFTLLMLGTGLSDLRTMVSTKSVENIPFLPFLTTDVNNLAWLQYGRVTGDWALVTVNAIGAALQTLYILAYLYYSPAKRPVLLWILLVLVMMVLAYVALSNGDPKTFRLRLGRFDSSLTIIMYLSPLASLAKVIRSKSTRCLSYPLTVTTFLASTSWTCYGLQRGDPYIMVPNVPGIATSAVRFWLFWRYPPGQDKAPRILDT